MANLSGTAFVCPYLHLSVLLMTILGTERLVESFQFEMLDVAIQMPFWYDAAI